MPLGVSTSIAAAILETQGPSSGHCACAPVHALFPPPAPAPHRVPRLSWRAGGQVGAEHVAAPLKGAGAGPPPFVGWRGGGGPNCWGGAGRGRADVSEPGGNVQKDSLSSPSPGKPPATLPHLGGGCFLRLRRDLPPRPRPAFPAAARLPGRRVSRRAPRGGKRRVGYLADGCRNPNPQTVFAHVLTRFQSRSRRRLASSFQLGKCSGFDGEIGALECPLLGPTAGIL